MFESDESILLGKFGEAVIYQLECSRELFGTVWVSLGQIDESTNCPSTLR
jgi:hypothetical protein